MGSGRVGRAKDLKLDERINLAIQAHVRHHNTDFSDLIESGVSPEEARKRVYNQTRKILAQWRRAPISIGPGKPYAVRLIPFSDRQLDWLREAPERLNSLSKEAFQNFFADRLSAMGLEVQVLGGVYERDGGIDLIAYPPPGSGVIPFLMAGQAKHKASTHDKIGPADVREFFGAIAEKEYHFGMFVTNTTFTPDADWYAKERRRLLRLRDLLDMRRWLNDDFNNEAEFKEMPDTIEYAPGKKIFIPKPGIELAKLRTNSVEIVTKLKK